MRIAAGVLLIIASLVNLVIGSGFVLCGGCLSTAGTVSAKAMEEVASDPSMAPEAEEIKEFARGVEKGSVLTGNVIIALGSAAFLLFIFQMVCAIMAFMSISKVLVLVVGVLSALEGIAMYIIGELAGIVLFTGSIVLLAGVFSVIAALGFGKEQPSA